MFIAQVRRVVANKKWSYSMGQLAVKWLLVFEFVSAQRPLNMKH